MCPDTGVPGEMSLIVLRVAIIEARDIIQDVPSSPPENNYERREDDTRPDKTNKDTGLVAIKNKYSILIYQNRSATE